MQQLFTFFDGGNLQERVLLHVPTLQAHAVRFANAVLASETGDHINSEYVGGVLEALDLVKDQPGVLDKCREVKQYMTDRVTVAGRTGWVFKDVSSFRVSTLLAVVARFKVAMMLIIRRLPLIHLDKKIEMYNVVLPNS